MGDLQNHKINIEWDEEYQIQEAQVQHLRKFHKEFIKERFHHIDIDITNIDLGKISYDIWTKSYLLPIDWLKESSKVLSGFKLTGHIGTRDPHDGMPCGWASSKGGVILEEYYRDSKYIIFNNPTEYQFFLNNYEYLGIKLENEVKLPEPHEVFWSCNNYGDVNIWLDTKLSTIFGYGSNVKRPFCFEYFGGTPYLHEIYIQYGTLQDRKQLEDYLKSQNWKEIVQQSERADLNRIIDENYSGEIMLGKRFKYSFTTQLWYANDALLFLSRHFPKLKIETIYHDIQHKTKRGFMIYENGKIKYQKHFSIESYRQDISDSNKLNQFRNKIFEDSEYIFNDPQLEILEGFGSLYSLVGDSKEEPVMSEADSKIIENVINKGNLSFAMMTVEINNKNHMKRIINLESSLKSIL